jgi:hypothetical protein
MQGWARHEARWRWWRPQDASAQHGLQGVVTFAKNWKQKPYAKDWRQIYKIGFVFANEGAIECMTRFKIAILLRGFLKQCGYLVSLIKWGLSMHMRQTSDVVRKKEKMLWKCFEKANLVLKRFCCPIGHFGSYHI